MKFYYYSALVLVVTMLSIGGKGALVSQSYAIDIGRDDCSVFNRVPRNGYAVFGSAYPQNLFETAIQNHANYCCSLYSNKDISQESSTSVKREFLTYCEEHPRTDFAKSPWLYDHLVDVGFRYLDGIADLQYPNTLVDPQGQERTSRIQELGTNSKGAIPLVIRSEYLNYRGKKDFSTELMLSQSQSCEASLPRLREYDENWSTIPLAKKYLITCEIASCLANDEKNKLMAFCQDLTLERIEREDNFVQSIISEQWWASISNHFRDYALEYLTYDRMDNFLQKVVMMAKWLGFVDQKVPEITLMCSG